MNEIASPEDLQSLLSALNLKDDGGRVDSFDETAGPAADSDSFELDAAKNKSIKIYDFKSPDKFSKDQMRTLLMIYENYSRSLSTTLSAYLRRIVNVAVSSIDQISYEQFTKAVANPSTLCFINMYPLKGSIMMELPPRITFAIIDRLFGGSGASLRQLRELTDIEMSVIEGVINRFLSNLKEAWSSIVDLRPRFEKIETNINFAQLVPLNDTVVMITLDTTVGKVEGSLLFCLPYIALESITNRLSARNVYLSGGEEEKSSSFLIRQHALEVPLNLTASLGALQLNVHDLLQLKEGDFLQLAARKDGLIELLVEEKKKYLVSPGRAKNSKNLAVKIKKILEEKVEKDPLFGVFK